VNCLCCEKKGIECLSRKCENCRDRLILFNEYEHDCPVTYHCWRSEKTERKPPKKSANVARNAGNECEEKTKTITVKVAIERPAHEIVDALGTSNQEYMAHLYRIAHQYETLTKLKDNLTANDLVLHVDFSENYQCKYASEVQSMHFGGSRESITLHTGIAYGLDFKESFCSISDSERHDPSSIIAHIDPILEKHLALRPLITKLHLIFDGPTTQYRNKTYFDLLTSYLPEKYRQLLLITHNFSEPGHGKGGPDGVGGFLKNLADDAVAHGFDVHNFEKFCALLEANVNGVHLEKVTADAISRVDNCVNKELKPFVGTMKVRQLRWSKENRHDIFFNTLSCFECELGKPCVHFGMNKQPWKTDEKTGITTGKKAVKRSCHSLPADKTKRVKRAKNV